MIGRKMRTILNLLHPRRREPANRNEQQNQQFNKKHGTVPRSFKAGDAVYAKVFTANKWKWSAGIIIESIGRVNYNVLLENNHGRRKLIRSHANQLKLRETPCKMTNKSNESPLSILIDMFGLQTIPNANQEELNPCQAAIQDMDVEVEEQANPVTVNLQDTHEDMSISFEPDPPEMEASEAGTSSISPTLEVRTRPQRSIKIPSRFEPYWVFRK